MYSLKDALKYHRPAINLGNILARPWMHRLRIFFAVVALLSGMATIALQSTGQSELATIAVAITLLATALWIEQLLIYSYHNYYYFFGLNSIIGLDTKAIKGSTYEVAEALLYSQHDIGKGFATSNIGELVLLRSGLRKDQVEAYVESTRTSISAEQIPVDETKLITLITIGTYLLQNDTSLKQLLASNGIQPEHFLGALSWVVLAIHQRKRTERWWSKDMLSKTPGIGRSLTYGHTYYIQKYTKSIYSSAVFANLTRNYDFTLPFVLQLEEALARSQSANALIVGAEGVGKMDIVIALADRIKRGEAIASVTDQVFIALDTDALFASHKDKSDFEQTFIVLMNESARAGNITLVIENISTFIKEAEALGVYIPELIDSYLSLPDLHVIALDTPQNYHGVLAKSPGFLRRFDEILIEEPGQQSTIMLLQAIAPHHERNGIFTYPALEAIAIGADRYLVDGVMPDKAVMLLIDMASRTPTGQLYTAEDVYTLIANKTGMPVGPITQNERDLLLNLEATLHARVIGQDAALSAIARTMRRTRAGIVNSERPLGSFLFLGSTGVGKTETAKALAYTFFGAEEKMIRLDMSEYSTEDRLGHLIGNAEEGGVLPALLQEHPYSVLLLDELEKATKVVHDVFLQILDEGMFTSGQGVQVNARNTIIIATSNAGSQYIIEALTSGVEIKTLTDEIIAHIIDKGIFRPELINRFDNTIIFEPLSENQQQSVAQLMLRSLCERIESQGYRLSITPELLVALVHKGYDPIFGARPLQRVIQDVIEEAVAQKIISGSIKKGDLITLDVRDVTL
jgi:ATP-dependent Clp protease ATP-binding subunit ClpC